MPTAILNCVACADPFAPGCCECDCFRRTPTNGCKFRVNMSVSGSFIYNSGEECGTIYFYTNGSLVKSQDVIFNGGSTGDLLYTQDCQTFLSIQGVDCDDGFECCDNTGNLCAISEIQTGTCGQAEACTVISGPPPFSEITRRTVSPGTSSAFWRANYKKNKQIGLDFLFIQLGGFFTVDFAFYLDPNGPYSLSLNWPGGSTIVKLSADSSLAIFPGANINFSGAITFS